MLEVHLAVTEKTQSKQRAKNYWHLFIFTLGQSFDSKSITDSLPFLYFLIFQQDYKVYERELCQGI